MTDNNSTDKKIGRNDPCPCGSGKKYKDCCLRVKEAEERRELFRKKVDGLYPKVNIVNSALLIKKRLDGDYKYAKFKEAMDFTVTSNALSLIRSVYQGSTLSATTALSARDVIEALVLIKMYEDGVLTEEDEKLFLWQYALMEYDTYYKVSEKFEALLDIDALTARYECAKKVYNEAGISGDVECGKLRQAVHSRVPFMYKHSKKGRKINFNTLLEDYLPSMLPHYVELSYYAHPNVNTATKSRFAYVKAIDAVIQAVAERYENYEKIIGAISGVRKVKDDLIADAGVEPLSVRLDRVCNPAHPENAVAYEIQSLMLQQRKILAALADDFEQLHRMVFGNKEEGESEEEGLAKKLIRTEDNYLTRFFAMLPTMLYDITYDYLLNLRECVKIKFKAVAETFAHFDRVITETINARAPLYGVTMLKLYELVTAVRRAGKKIPDEFPEATAGLICNAYRENYPEDVYTENPLYYNNKKKIKLTEKKSDRLIMQSFCQPLGNFLDGNGHVPKFLDIIDGFFAKTYGEKFILNRADSEDGVPLPTDIPAKDYINMLYRESNNMSHGCGYLYFSNLGAFRDDGPIIQALDHMICDAVGVVISETEKWQKANGQEEHYTINEFVKNLTAAQNNLSIIAVRKYVLIQSGTVDDE